MRGGGQRSAAQGVLRGCLIVIAAIGGPTAKGDDPPPRTTTDLTVADLAPYRAALDRAPEGPALVVTFRQLWEDPEAFRGRHVRVEGRVARRFRQGAFGTFPPLVEAWAATPAGDPFCLVFPASKTRNDPAAAPGATVRFDGVFLRMIRYQGGDSTRLAPLVVGSQPPTSLAFPPTPIPARMEQTGPWGAFSPIEWGLGLGAAGLVMVFLVGQYLKRPRAEFDPKSAREGPPEFLDPS